jgi:hypothetical protein
MSETEKNGLFFVVFQNRISSRSYIKYQNIYENINGAELVKSLDRMILSGAKPHLIQQKTGVAIQIMDLIGIYIDPLPLWGLILL